MILIKDYCSQKTTFTAEYVSDIPTISIISDSISDDIGCFRFQVNSFAWLSREGCLVGVECVSPTIVESDECIYTQGLSIEVYSHNMLVVETSYDEKRCILWIDQNDDSHYVLVLNDAEKANKKFCFDNVYFYAYNDMLVAIEIDRRA